MMLKQGEQYETVSIHRQPDPGDIEASGSWRSGNRSMPGVRHELREVVTCPAFLGPR